MPRLTDQSYLLQQHDLRDHWLDESRNAFLLLSANEQWDLHLYYAPNLRLGGETLIEHRQDISTYDPSLPQRAGRALAKLRITEQRLQSYRVAPKPARKKKKNAPYELHVLGEVHPEINAELLVKALLNYERRDDADASRRRRR
jgi:hypothetical protein